MAWPPPLPPNDRTNATPLLDSHASDHNMIVDALTELVARFGSIRAKSQALTTDAAGKAVVIFNPAFPTGVVPIVQANTGFDNVFAIANPVTKDGCTFTFRRHDGTYVASFALTVHYVAIAPTP